MNKDLHLDVHFNAIRHKFDLLNQKLDEARNERDEFKRNCIVCFGHFLWIANVTRFLDMNQAKELQELRQTVFSATKSQIVCQNCKSSKTTDNVPTPILSPVSPSTESYFSVNEEEGSRGDNLQDNETRNVTTNLSLPSDITYFPHPDDRGVTYRVESNHDTKVALKLCQVHTLTKSDSITYAVFSPDGKYLAGASDGAMHIFDAKTGKRLR